MMIPEDEQCVQRMTGLDQIPKDVNDEYMLRVRMYHRHSSGGPLGASILISMLRYLGYGPPDIGGKATGAIDWRKVEEGTKVDYRQFGEWSPQDEPGTYQGAVSAGTLAVKTPSGINEFDRFNVRLHDDGVPEDFDQDSMDNEGTMRSDAVEPDVRAELADKPRRIDNAERKRTRTGRKPKRQVPVKPNDTGEVNKDDTPPDDATDWGKVDSGSKLWVDLDDDIRDASLVAAKDDGTLIVSVAGKQVTVDADAVQLVK